MLFRTASSSDLYEPHGELRTRLWLLLPLRLYAGMHFFLQAIDKVKAGFLSTPEMAVSSVRPIIESDGYSHGAYRAIFENVIAPNPGLTAFLVVFGELFVGVCLFSGTLTRFACWCGLVMLLNYYLAFDVGFFAEPHNTTSFGAILLVLGLTGAGRAYGTDHYLRGKLPGFLV